MSRPAIEALKQALEREWNAVRSADIDALVEVQDEKQRALENIQGVDLSETEHAQISRAMQINIMLTRHLVSCLRGFVLAGEEPAYNAAGQPVARGTARPIRGSL